MTANIATVTLPGERGGWNACKNVDALSPESLSSVVNINLHNGAKETRGGLKNLSYSPSEVFTAFNDCSWSIGQTNSNITVYSKDDTGFLIDYITGVVSPVTIAITGGSVAQGTVTQGSNANSGTDAYGVFAGAVDCKGVISYAYGPYADTVVTFSGLNTKFKYEVVLFSNRDGDFTPDRITTYTISGHSAFKNQSSAGTFLNEADTSTDINGGENTVNGHIAKFAEVTTSTGSFVITLSSADFHPYLNAIKFTATPPIDNITGIYQYNKENLTTNQLTSTSAGVIYSDGVSVKTGLQANKVCKYETYLDKVYIANAYDVPQLWDGSSVSDLAAPKRPTDWSGAGVYPKGFVVHGRGVSKALWAYGVPTKPNVVYCSESGTDDFSDAKVYKQTINTGDGYGILALFEFGDRLFAIGRNKVYMIEDDDTSRTNWGYSEAQWSGGVLSGNLVCRTPNDVVVVSKDLIVYSVIATQQYGDYQALALNRASFIDIWMRENLDITKSDLWHMSYDSVMRAIKIFVVEKGSTSVNLCLVYFVDRGVNEGWVLHRYAKGGMANCASAFLSSTGTTIRTGGESGAVYQLESTEYNDGGLSYYSGFTTSPLNFGTVRSLKRFDRVWVSCLPLGDETLTANMVIDGVLLPSATGSESNTPLLVDNVGNHVVDDVGIAIETTVIGNWWELPQSDVIPGSVVDYSNAIGRTGNRLQVELFNTTINTKMFVTQIMIDFGDSGNKPY